MRKAIYLAGILLVGALAMTGCGGKKETSLSNDDVIVEVEEKATVTEVDFEHQYTLIQGVESEEYAFVRGKDADGNVVWEYETSKSHVVEVRMTEEIGVRNDKYYLTENGKIVVLDMQEGTVLWENTQYGGGGTKFAFGADDTLYCCSYLGPDFFAVDKDGNTLKKYEQFNKDYCWPYKIEYTDTEVTVSFELAPYKEEQYMKCIVSLKDFSYRFPKPQQTQTQTQTTPTQGTGTQNKQLTVEQICQKVENYYNKALGVNSIICFQEEVVKTKTGYSVTIRTTGGNEANALMGDAYVNTSTGAVTDDCWGYNWNIYK